ncbi:SRPBCC family protein [Phytohabitans kaempferiae]|uniref:SRPBCC domain-containing protein n=1 Tax=Phytohabitans kaempferiae TaxID=1620943 RepID=A0ABV6MAX8_9ACTN
MADILHRIGATAPLEKVYDALATCDGLAGWWTTGTTGESAVGGTIQFRFGDTGGFDMKVLDQRPNERVEWEVTDGDPAWIGTRITFDLRREGDDTLVLFKHEGWREPGEFMSHCTTKWATYMLSLKRLVETGTGTPYPRDVRISGDWH